MRPHLDHLDERAELYALGLLAADESERADAHVSVCRACAQRLGRAEATVAAMVDATLAPEAAPRAMLGRIPTTRRTVQLDAKASHVWRWAAAGSAAAAVFFALWTGALIGKNAALQASVVTDGSVFGAMVHSHFSHVQFQSLDGTPIDAKAVYERHGGWYEILATGIPADTRIAIVRGGIVSSLPEHFTMRGDALTLALPALGAVDELQLLDAQGRLIARARPMLTARER